MATKKQTTNPQAAELAQQSVTNTQVVRAAESDRDVAGMLRTSLEKYLPQLAESSLKAVDPSFYISTALTILRGNDKLRKAAVEAPDTLIHSMLKANQLGLRLEPELGQAWLIPRRNKNTRRNEITFMPGYRGYVAKMWNSGKVTSMQAEVVYVEDEFEIVYGFPQTLRHKPAMKDRTEKVGVWAGFNSTLGGFQFVWINAEEMAVIRADYVKESPDYKSVWETNEDEMWKKTAVRRLWKLAPIEDLHVAQMIQADEDMQYGALSDPELPPEKEVKQQSPPAGTQTPVLIPPTPKKEEAKSAQPVSDDKLRTQPVSDKLRNAYYDKLVERANALKDIEAGRALYKEAVGAKAQMKIGTTMLDVVKAIIVKKFPDIVADPKAAFLKRVKEAKTKGAMFALKTELMSMHKSGKIADSDAAELRDTMQQIFEGLPA